MLMTEWGLGTLYDYHRKNLKYETTTKKRSSSHSKHLKHTKLNRRDTGGEPRPLRGV